MDELEVIQSYGAMTAPEIAVLTNRNRISSWRSITFFIKTGDVHQVEIQEGKIKHVLYIENAIYKDIFQD